VEYETNDDDGAVDIDGAWGSPYIPIIKNLSIILCVPPAPATGTLNAETQNNASGFWDIALSNHNIVPHSLAGVMFGTEIFNLSVISTISFLNGGGMPVLSPWPAATFPGVTSSSLSVSFALSSVTDLSLQGVATAAASPVGFVLMQPTELHVVTTNPVTSVPGPTTDDMPVTIDLTQHPFCALATGINFYGTVYTALSVSPNGRVEFGPGTLSFSPTVAEWLTGNPTIGVWSDYDPSLAGSVTVVSPSSDLLCIEYVNVPYFNQPSSSASFKICFDADCSSTGCSGSSDASLKEMSASGIANFSSSPTENMILGMSPGASGMVYGSATDGGNINFAGGTQGSVGTVTDALYDFLDVALYPGTLPASLGGIIPPATAPLPGTPVVSILFVDDGAGNYSWTGL
jgi:hypothetical protein